MNRLRAALLFLPLVLLLPTRGEAQIHFGAHATQAHESFGGTYGAGLRVGISTPVLPLDVFATGEYFFPDCPALGDGCGMYGASLEANFRMVFPIVRPYISGGLAYRKLDLGLGGPSEATTGVTIGAGVDVGLGRVRLFGEGRYEFIKAPERQRILRVGILLGGG